MYELPPTAENTSRNNPMTDTYFIIPQNCLPVILDRILIWGRFRQVSTIRRTLVGNEIVDRSDVVGASPVGAAPTTSSFST